MSVSPETAERQDSGPAARAVRCRAPDNGDAFDVELARRLNTLQTTTDPGADHRLSMRPIVREIVYWGLATACLIVVAAFWLV